MNDTFYGTTLQDEEKKLAKVREIAHAKVKTIEENAAALQEDLKSLREVYDVDDKEGLSQWFNTNSRFAEVRNDLNRARRALNKPFFGRIDLEDPETGKKETFYIGKTLIAADPAKPDVIDWRAPVSSVYYDHSLGKCSYKVPQIGIFQTDLKRKRTYEIENEKLVDFYDSDVVANDELLTKYLAKSKRNVLSEIIATIQQEQNEIIRKDPHHNVLIQGSAGSGKTTVAMHRISYILYNYAAEFKPESFYIVGSNRVLLNYITGVLPDLDVYGVSQMTMEALFVRLLYEDWDKHTQKIRSFDRTDAGLAIKSGSGWFESLRAFCSETERKLVPFDDIRLESTGRIILERAAIEKVFAEYPDWSLSRKAERLNDLLWAGLENEIYGKYYSYGTEEKKKLSRRYKNWFLRYLWKKSVFVLYEQFIEKQRFAHPESQIPYIPNEPDLYDLAGLAYLYKRLKEIAVIQEASHVIIDEAQDFGISIYRSLCYCMSKCTFTVMGDVSQNINFKLGLSDWEELKEVLLPNKYDYFGLLKKSYRNTVEISMFATDILRHGTFPIYPVEPIIRHGDDVFRKECEDRQALVACICQKIKEYCRKNYETIAVICRNQKEAETAFLEFTDAFAGELPINLFSEEQDEFHAGICILPIEYSKGLEFDAVIIFDASPKNYPKEDGHARLLYVAATRALHELAVFALEKLTGLILDPVLQSRKQLTFPADTFHQKPVEFEEEFRTREELAAIQADLGNWERAQRDKYGPKKIAITTGRSAQTAAASKQTLNSVKSPVQKSSNSASMEFYSIPASVSLTPVGHGKIDNSIRWIWQEKEFAEITSNYGLLRIIPVSDETARIQFFKNGTKQAKEMPLPEEISCQKALKWNIREFRDHIQLTMDKLVIKIPRKTGALEFYTQNGILLLSENSLLPRQYHGAKDIWWEYFAWSKKESLSTRGESDEIWKDLKQTAKYISHGPASIRPALLMSSKGYQILIPGGIRTLACTIPAHGPYLCFENSERIDYLFRTFV